MKKCICCGNELNNINFITIPGEEKNTYICSKCIKSMSKTINKSEDSSIAEDKKKCLYKALKEVILTYMSVIDHQFDQDETITRNEAMEVMDFLISKMQTIISREIQMAPLEADMLKQSHFYVLYSLYKLDDETDYSINEFKSEVFKHFNENKEAFITSYINKIPSPVDALIKIRNIEKKNQLKRRIHARKDDINENIPNPAKNVQEEKDEEVEITLKTPKQIKAELDKYVIGQEKAKKTLSVGIYNHYKRITNKKSNIAKSNIMLVGSTGVGKTELARSVAKILDVPFVIADSTSMTETGYVGGDVEDMLKSLIAAADNNIKKAETGIIYIDEIDKIARGSGSGRDVGREGVQQALLKIVEGNKITLKYHKGPVEETVDIDTTNILFICGGAFEAATMKEKNTNKVALGFNSTETIEEDEEEKIDTKVMIKNGMIPELVGRFPIIIKLDDLTTDDLKRILVEPEGSLIKQYKELLEIENIDLEFTNNALNLIAEKAYNNKTGARGLRTIIEDSITDLMYEIPDEKNIKKIQVGINNGQLCFRKN